MRMKISSRPFAVRINDTCKKTLYALSFLIVSFASSHASYAAGDGYLGWRWDGQYYPTALAACEAQWKWAGMDNGYSRFIGDFERPGSQPWVRDCKWTSFQYLCPQETGGGIVNCWTVLPTIVSLSCEAGYSRMAPNRCVKSEDLQPQRPACGYDNGAKPNPIIGNPIILTNGTKYHNEIDFLTADSKFKIDRIYRSEAVGRTASLIAMPLGLPSGWQFNFAMEIQLGDFSGTPTSPKGSVTLIAPDGSGYDFTLQNNGKWLPNTSMGAVSTDYTIKFVGNYPDDVSKIKQSSSEWEVTGPDDRRWLLKTVAGVNTPTRFAIGRPTTVTERDGYQWNYHYKTDGSLETIIDSFGRTISFEWNYFYVTALQNIAGSLPYPEAIKSITYPDGTSTHYSYDPTPSATAPSTSSILRLTGVEWKDTANAVVNSTKYHYENADYLTALTGITDHRNIRIATYEYDTSGRVISSSGEAGANRYTVEYTRNGSQISRRVTNPLGKQTVYRFSTIGSSQFNTHLIGVDGEASTNCVASNSSYQYNSAEFLASQTDEEGRITEFARDTAGRVTKLVQAKGTPQEQETTITWHPTLNVPALIVQPGLSTSYIYGSNGRLQSKTETDTTTQTLPYATNGETRIWTYTYTAAGLIETIDGPLPGNADTTSFTYDVSGYIQTIRNPVGHITTVLSVNGRGQPTQTQDPNGLITEFQYDALGRMTSAIEDPAGVAARSVFDYDAVGNVIKITDPDGSFFAMQYDGNNRLTEIKDNYNQTITYTYDLMGNRTSEETRNGSAALYFKRQQNFDELGRLLRVIRANSASWTYGYDKVGNITSLTDPSGSASASAYDSLNRLISYADERTSTTTFAYENFDSPTSITDPRSVVTSYVRNGWGESIQQQSNDIGTVVYRRNARGDIVEKTDARGVVTQYAYDASGRVTSVTYPAETGSNISYHYDAVTNDNFGIGRLTSLTDAAGSLEYRYDLLGRLVQEARQISGQTYQTSYKWDLAGNLTDITYPSGRVVHFGRNDNGNIANVNTRASETAPSVGLAWWVSHTPFGPMHGLLYGNGLDEWRTFDQDARMVAQVVHNTAVTPTNRLLDRTYHYGDGKNLLGIANHVDASQSETYWYTSNGFIQNAAGVWGELTYYIDGSGNITHRILEKDATTTTEVYGYPGNSNRLANIFKNNVASRNFAYDAAGNIVSDTDAPSNTAKTFTYNSAGSLSTAAKPSGITGKYTYSYNSLLKIRELPATSNTLHYVHDIDGKVLAEYTSTGTLLREYVWLDEKPLAVVDATASPAPSIYFVHSDQLDRPVLMTDAAMTVVWQATYLPFGEVYSVTGSVAQDHRFPGQWFQVETGLNYNWYRHYDPTTGRYLQPDPLGMPDGPNRWAYVQNSPLMNVDPRGTQLLIIPGRKPLPWVPGNPWLPEEPPYCATTICYCVQLYWEATKALMNAAKGGGDASGQRPGKTPNEGAPGSTHINPGSKQVRKYGPDGKPVKDIDYDHGHGLPIPHVHEWGRNSKGEAVRGPGRPFDPDKDS